jgi:hypothetical protein
MEKGKYEIGMVEVEVFAACVVVSCVLAACAVSTLARLSAARRVKRNLLNISGDLYVGREKPPPKRGLSGVLSEG